MELCVNTYATCKNLILINRMSFSCKHKMFLDLFRERTGSIKLENFCTENLATDEHFVCFVHVNQVLYV